MKKVNQSEACLWTGEEEIQKKKKKKKRMEKTIKQRVGKITEPLNRE